MDGTVADAATLVVSTGGCSVVDGLLAWSWKLALLLEDLRVEE